MFVCVFLLVFCCFCFAHRTAIVTLTCDPSEEGSLTANGEYPTGTYVSCFFRCLCLIVFHNIMYMVKPIKCILLVIKHGQKNAIQLQLGDIRVKFLLLLCYMNFKLS